MLCRVSLLSLCLVLLAFPWGHLLGDDTTSPSKLPASTPWNLEKLSQPPEFYWVDDAGPVRSLFYVGEWYNGIPTRVFAYYATPGTLAGDTSQDKNLPAVVLVHGGGGTAFREWAELWAKRGYAAIAMDLSGHRPIENTNPHSPENRVRHSGAGPDQGDDEKFGSIAKPVEEQWPYHAVANVIRAHSLVRSFPEVDPERTAITGISWGGYLTCMVAGVDSRFRVAVPVYGCGFLAESSVWHDRMAQMSSEDRERWTTLWDPAQYLPSVSMPILFMNGTNDGAYFLDSYQKSYDLVPAPKQIRVTVNMPHSHPDGWAPQEIGLFVDQYLRGSTPLPKVDAPRRDGEQVVVPYSSALPLKTAEIHWTTESGPINRRKWESQPGTIETDKVTTPAPPAEATVWFVTVTDERKATVSTEVQFALAPAP
ncbi:MAG: alpha/beta fold hydrolase [Pirellulales bacterium]|nr:alpha/beta fold hydrolase [Pirellulales bacterium]